MNPFSDIDLIIQEKSWYLYTRKVDGRQEVLFNDHGCTFRPEVHNFSTSFRAFAHKNAELKQTVIATFCDRTFYRNIWY